MEEKKALGIRANGFLSRLALSELTDLGKASPLTAHETTLLRASFSVMRYNAVQQEAQLKKQLGRCFVGFEYDVLAADCETCIALSGKVTNGSNAFVLPPPTCTCDTANYGLRQKIDWLADIT